jgi:secretion/DNA translocation related TadE-like protein
VRITPDRGSASVLVLGICLAALLLGSAVAGLGSAVVARHEAESVADLAALAAADVLVGRAPGPACAAAERIVRSGGGDHGALVDCQVRGRTAEVTVRSRPAGWVAALGPATGRARAGPSGPVPGGPQ